MYGDYKTVYIGYYTKGSNKIVLAVSKKKDVVKNYLENHRGLLPDRYEIEKEELSDGELLSKYSDKVISNYMGYYIPEIDQNIIDIYSEDVNLLINVTMENLKRIYLLANNIKKISDEDVGYIINLMKVLMKFKSNKIMKKLKKENNKNFPILFCNIEEYLNYIRSYKDQKELNQRYREIMMSDK